MPLGRWSAAERFTLSGLLEAQAAKRPDQPCLIVSDEVITYGGLQARAASAAAALGEWGIRPGDAVAIFANTCPEWLSLWFGAARLGAVTVPINTAYRGEFLANPLRDAGCRLVLVDDTLADRLGAVAADVPALEVAVVRRTPGAVLPDLPWRSIDAAALGEAAPEHRGPAASWDDPVSILYTSGTTGASKGAVITNNYLVASAATMVRSWRLAEHETLYAPLPLFHISAVGSVAGPILAGATGLLDPVFSVRTCWDRVRRHRAAGILLAGAMVSMLWNLPPDPSDRALGLRFMSAAPIPRGLHRPIEARYGLKVVTSYGMTEAFPMTVYGYHDEVVEGATGRPQPNLEVVLLDEDDEPVAPGEVGQICCRPTGPHLMFEGYHGHPDTTVERWRNLWFHSGDLGRMDADGNLTYVDRNKDVMRRRGENISSFEVEQTLLRHPSVADAAAVAVPSELGEDDVKVVVAPKDDAHLEAVELMDFCVERLPYFAVPRYIEFVAELPKNASGKVIKTQLRAAGVTPSTWDREAAGYRVSR